MPTMKRLLIVLMMFILPACGQITCSQKRHRAIRYMNNGVQKFADGLHSQAVRDLEAAVREDDTFSTGHYNLAKVYQKMGKWDDAQRHLNRVTTLEPKVARYHYDLGLCYHRLSRLDLAAESYGKALSLNQNLYAAHLRLGMVYTAKDRPRDADEAFRKAIDINPRFTKAFVKLGLLYLDYDYPEQALQVLQTGITINATSGEAHNMTGVAFQMLKKYDKAIEMFKKAYQLDRNLYDAVYNLGMTYAAVGKKKLAEKELTTFSNIANGKSGVDPDYIRAAQEMIADMQGGGSGQSGLPTRLQ